MINFPAAPDVNDLFVAVGLTWKWDGEKWLAFTSGGGGGGSGDIFTYAVVEPTNGATIDLSTDDCTVLDPAGVLATMTARLPVDIDGHVIRIATRQRIDGLSIVGLGGVAVDWATGELPENGVLNFLMVNPLNAWVRV